MLSIVIPVYNEQDSLLPLHERLSTALENVGADYEVILVNDGSTDATDANLRTIAAKDSRYKVVSFRRNFGQTAAMMAGFDFASGDIIIPLDGDLQNDPKDIPRLVAKLNEGYDLVNGWRIDRQDPFLHRRLPSQIANSIISLTTGVRLHDYGCTLKAFRRDVAKNLKLYGEM